MDNRRDTNFTNSASDVYIEEVQEIIGTMPHWLIRWGITMVTIIFIGFLIGCYFFRYPDVFPAKVTITSFQPPIEIVTERNCYIQNLLVSDRDSVYQGQDLCVVYNSANYFDVKKLITICNTIDTATTLETLARRICVPPNLRVGGLQNGYNALSHALEEYKEFLSRDDYKVQLNHINKLMKYNENVASRLRGKRELLQQLLEKKLKRFEIDSILRTEQLITQIEFENSTEKRVSEVQNYERYEESLINSKIKEIELKKDIIDEMHKHEEKEDELLHQIRERVKSVMTSLYAWEETNVMKSPIDGVVSFYKVWKEFQYAEAGECVMIVTSSRSDIVVKGYAFANNFGRIKVGQQGFIDVNSFPANEFGYLEAIVSKVSTTPVDSFFAFNVSLKNGLTSTLGKKLPSTATLRGDMEIIVADKSVFQRLFEQLK